MKTSFTCNRRTHSPFHCGGFLRAAGALVLLLAFLRVQVVAVADEPGLTKQAQTTAQQAGEAVQDAGRAVAADAEGLWQRIDAARLKNRTPDEIVAWMIMGVLVGAVAGMATSLKPSGWGKLGRLLLGLSGAFLGGMVVRTTNLDFGWGFVLIRYEELLVSFLGAILLIVLARFILPRARKKPPGQPG